MSNGDLLLGIAFLLLGWVSLSAHIAEIRRDPRNFASRTAMDIFGYGRPSAFLALAIMVGGIALIGMAIIRLAGIAPWLPEDSWARGMRRATHWLWPESN